MKHLLLFVCLALTSRVFAAQNQDQTGIKSETTITATTTSTLVLAKNIDRKYLLVQNNGATNIIVKFGSAHSASEGIVVPGSGGSYEPLKCPYDAVYIKSASSTDSVNIVEGN